MHLPRSYKLWKMVTQVHRSPLEHRSDGLLVLGITSQAFTKQESCGLLGRLCQGQRFIRACIDSAEQNAEDLGNVSCLSYAAASTYIYPPNLRSSSASSTNNTTQSHLGSISTIREFCFWRNRNQNMEKVHADTPRR